MASVYLAHDPNFRRNVAVKLISVNFQENPVFRERFEREARLIAQIEHPAIVPVYDFGAQGDQLYLVMRYMAGGTLADKIKQGNSTLGYAVKILSQIAPALDAVHAQGVVHRDLKPGNILLDGFGNAAISDFGIAHLTAVTIDLTGSAIIGTPSYMSPEQVRGDDLDGRSDVYALGVILFEMLTGHGPFHASTPMSVALKHLTDPVPSIRSLRPDLPADVESILNKALAKDKERRYATASELALDLQGILEKYPGSATSMSQAEQPSRKEDAATEVDGESVAAVAPSASRPSNISSINTPEPPSVHQRSTLKRPLLRAPQIILGGIVGIILLFICSSLGVFGTWLGLSGLRPEQTATLTVAPTRVPTEFMETVLFADDFSDQNSGWPSMQNEQASYGYQADGYHIAAEQVNSAPWAKTNRIDEDISIHVDARPIVSSANGYYGLLCRIQDNQNFYYFVVQPTGNYVIGKFKDGEFQPLFPEGLRTSDAIKQGNQTNRIQADCVGNILRLHVNGVLIDEVTDSDFSSGYSGLTVATYDTQRFEVVFNNFLITASAQ